MRVGTISGAGTQNAGVEITAVKYPVCLCGEPWTAHTVAHCIGYRPIRPVEELGTRAYSPRPNMAWWRRAICRWVWVVEVNCQHWRERVES